MNGNEIHTWTSSYFVMSHAYLLRDSSVLFPCGDNLDYGQGRFPSGVALPGGRFQIIKWNGAVAWDFPYHGKDFMPHHDCYPHYYTKNIKEMPSVFAVVATIESDSTIAEKIVEIKPTGDTTANIVWEWRAWDHRTGNGTNKPELLDINKGGLGAGWGKEWLHANHVRYNPFLDQVLVDLKYFNEFIIIDHGTTKQEAAGHSGGKRGKGGDILYRWGNPINYGCPDTQYLNGQHGACWIPNHMPGTKKDLPGAGHVLVISNIDQKGYEVVLPSASGVYPRASGKAFGPAAPLWQVKIVNMSTNEGSMQRLPNGNTLIGNGLDGLGADEYNSNGTSIWSLSDKMSGEIFRYDSAYLGSTILDTEGISSKTIDDLPSLKRSPASRPVIYAENGGVHISFNAGNGSCADIAVYSATGRMILRKKVADSDITWNTGNQPDGVYFVIIANGGQRTTARFILARGR